MCPCCTIYPKELELKETTESVNSCSYLDLLLFKGENDHLKVKFMTRDDFSFKIVNYPFLDSNIPIRPAYGIYVNLDNPPLYIFIQCPFPQQGKYISRAISLFSSQVFHIGHRFLMLIWISHYHLSVCSISLIELLATCFYI